MSEEVRWEKDRMILISTANSCRDFNQDAAYELKKKNNSYSNVSYFKTVLTLLMEKHIQQN